jgi:hypothetical protein
MTVYRSFVSRGTSRCSGRPVSGACTSARASTFATRGPAAPACGRPTAEGEAVDRDKLPRRPLLTSSEANNPAAVGMK